MDPISHIIIGNTFLTACVNIIVQWLAVNSDENVTLKKNVHSHLDRDWREVGLVDHGLDQSANAWWSRDFPICVKENAHSVRSEIASYHISIRD